MVLFLSVTKSTVSYADVETVLVSSRKISYIEQKSLIRDEYVELEELLLTADRTPYNAVQSLIVKYSEKYGIDHKLPLEIARAESGYVVDAKNKSSSASGLFQFIDSTFGGWCIEKYQLTDTMEKKNDPEIQAECAVRMLSEGGKSHWSESEFMWGRSF